MSNVADHSHDSFHGAYESVESLLEAADNRCSHATPLRGICLASDTPLDILIQQFHGTRARLRGFHTTESNPCLVQLPVPDRESQSGTSMGKAFIWKSSASNAVYILSTQPRGIFESVRDAMCSYLRPTASRTYLRTREMHSALRSLARRIPSASIRVRGYVAKSLVDDPDTGKRVRRTVQGWTDEDYAEVFHGLAEDGKWLSSVQLEVRDGQCTSGRITRGAEFSCQTGFVFFHKTVLAEVERLALQSLGLYQQRDRTTSPTGHPRPLKLHYERDVFADKRQNHRLIDVLTRLPNSAVSVMHPNPYLHASLVDYSDGSSCEIWVTTPDEVLLVPRRRSSPDALGRLCDFICDEFEEGKLMEAGDS